MNPVTPTTPTTSAATTTRSPLVVGARVVATAAAATGVVSVAMGPRADAEGVLVVLALVWGLGWLTVSWWLVTETRHRLVAGLALLAGVSLVVGSVVEAHTTDHLTAQRLVAVAAVAVLPVLWVSFPGAPPRLLRYTVVPVAVVVGIAVLLWSLPEVVVDVAVLVVALAVVAGIWWRLESEPHEREPLLWNAYGLVASLVCTLPVTFGDAEWPIVLLTSLGLLLSCAGVVVGAHPPTGVDIRVLILRTAVYAVAVLVSLAAFSGLAALLELYLGHPPAMGALAVLSVLLGAAFFPVRRWLASVLDRLLYGDRLDTVTAAQRFGEELSSTGEPGAALDALRAVLWLPYAALEVDGTVVADSGTPGASGDYRIPLLISRNQVGLLVVGLRPGERRLSAQDRAAMRIVVPALAQAVHAQGLAEDLRRSRQQAVTAIEDERRRLRRDLHDGLGPTLTGVAYAADAARNVLADNPQETDRLLTTVRSDVSAAIADVRRLIDGLRPSALDQLGLVAAIEQHSTHLHTANGHPLQVTVHALRPLPALAAATEVAAYRIVTEALTNVSRHSGSDRAEVGLTVDGPTLRVSVSDHGSGSVTAWTPGVGLSSMRERAEQLGGSFSATVTPAGGNVLVYLPLG